jgi:uncharacterized protein YtpQ (UPF0354 family)
MQQLHWQTFIHPHKAYRLEYPSHWEHRVEDDGRSCGFGPKERDDVGVWISILPASLDTDRFAEDLPKMFRESLQDHGAANIRNVPEQRHHCLQADMTKDGQGGHFWIIAGGDIVLFASSQVPVAERDAWNTLFERLVLSLTITRDDELLLRRLSIDVLEQLREKCPEQEYEFDDKGLRGKNNVVSLDNLLRQVRLAPDRREVFVREFVEGIASTTRTPMGHETWEQAEGRLMPVLKPRSYIKPETATRNMVSAEWLADVVICYAIRSTKTFRFVNVQDCERWGIDEKRLHDQAMQNLVSLDWPSRMEGARQPGGGRLILVHTGDSFAASRLLHPELYTLFSRPLGAPFLAGIPERDTLVVFSNKPSLHKRIAKQVKKDHDRSAYPITPKVFLVTRDGIALAGRL